jgi:hypothetical protein
VIVSQIKKECWARDETLERYLAVIRRMENYFKVFTVEHIERTKNTEADGWPRLPPRKQYYHRMYFSMSLKTPP